ncbi:hypothetical protein [Paenibacillus sp. IITD108]|uniref:hypothetical protein n=1 Tax=Paenibacillus sp. IITD108 TaxID=3116649 RepID=UPI002F3EC81C
MIGVDVPAPTGHQIIISLIGQTNNYFPRQQIVEQLAKPSSQKNAYLKVYLNFAFVWFDIHYKTNLVGP